MKPFEWGLIAGVLGALLLTFFLIKVDESCSYRGQRQQDLLCEIAHGYTRVMAPEAR